MLCSKRDIEFPGAGDFFLLFLKAFCLDFDYATMSLCLSSTEIFCLLPHFHSITLHSTLRISSCHYNKMRIVTNEIIIEIAGKYSVGTFLRFFSFIKLNLSLSFFCLRLCYNLH